MEDPWFPTVISMLEDIPYSCSIIKDAIMDAFGDWALKGLQSLHLTPWLSRDIISTDNGSFPHSVRQWRVDLSVYNKTLPAVLERMGQMVCFRG